MADINKLNYKTIAQTLTSHDRAIYLHFENSDLPALSIEHERVFKNEDGSVYKKDYLGMIRKEFEAGGKFPLYNPLSDEPMGANVTHEYLMVIMYSLYKQLITEKPFEPIQPKPFEPVQPEIITPTGV